ncbi:sulfotransferase family 2 domain-containing protein [Lutimaribacter marinistellae]|uniref:Sulfotransferase family 2 domain-containing protein n=1 Tax=Lutimaribacter marinistellae TaxID=1820329 RepID=A0ABV7TJH3_9RHOB
MIISPGRGYIFVHIPKTGGTSLALALEARAKKDDIMLGDTPKARQRRHRVKGAKTRGRLWKHATLADIDGLIAPQQLAGLFAFTLVRNPWDRAVSYYHWLRVQAFDHPAVGLAKSLEFERFVTHADTLAAFSATPARHYMTRADGVEQCAAYIRIEELVADQAPLAVHLGFKLDPPHQNRSQRDRDYRPYFSDRSAEAIATACAEDIARFGYSFG